jgi:hypothetical protein
MEPAVSRPTEVAIVRPTPFTMAASVEGERLQRRAHLRMLKAIRTQ